MASEILISVLLPTSLTIDAPDLRQKATKIGMVGRALAIFRVDRVCVYDDNDPNVESQDSEAKTLTTILSYMETPQYLRKLLFPRSNELRFAGLLYPLRTPHHPLKVERNRPGDYREGAVIKTGKRSLIEIGLPEMGVIDDEIEVGQRLTVRLGKKANNLITVTPVPREEVPDYWGYDVIRARSLSEGLKAMKPDYSIGTSRLGQNLYEAMPAIKSSKPRRMAVVFGSPYAGLFEICKRQGVDAGELFDVVVNAIPGQGTSTVRTEEALLATLSLLNVLTGEKNG